MPRLPEIKLTGSCPIKQYMGPGNVRGGKSRRNPCLMLLTAAMLFLAVSCGGGNSSSTIEDETVPAPPETVAQPLPIISTALPASPAEKRQEEINEILTEYSVDRQFAHINKLASDSYQGRLSGSAGARAAADYISAKFSQLGLKPWTAAGLGSFKQPFAVAGVSSENIIGVLPGKNPGAFIILGAHYDHLGVDASGAVYNGADDNAAGVAALLEAAEILDNLGLTPQKNIIFCAFSGEEQGQLGATALGQRLTEAGLAASVEMINIDGIGATGGNYFGIWDEGSTAAAPIVNALKEAGLLLGVPVREEGTDIGSDAQPFDWKFGIPAVTVDWHWGKDTYAYHPYYHSVSDDADKISRPALSQATKVSIVGLWIKAS